MTHRQALKLFCRTLLFLAPTLLPSLGFAEDLKEKWLGKIVHTQVGMRFDHKGKQLVSPSTNFLGNSEVLPAGSKLTVSDLSRNSVTLAHSGTKYNIPFHIQYVEKHTQLAFGEYLDRTLSLTEVKLPGTLSKSDRALVTEGKYAVGMTREALLLSVGYPPATLNLSFDGATLVYQMGRFKKIAFHFNKNVVSVIDGNEQPAKAAEGDKWTGREFFSKVNFRANFDDPVYRAYSTNYVRFSKLFLLNTKFKVLAWDSKDFKLQQVSKSTVVEFKFVADHSQMPVEEYLGTLLSETEVNVIGTLAKRDRELVKSGLAEKGMSRQALLIALGNPPANLNPSLEAGKLIYMTRPAQKMIVKFDKSNTVVGIEE